MSIVFWISVLGIFYVYIGYPAIVALLAKTRSQGNRHREGKRRTLSVIITAFNEEKVIRQRLDDIAAQGYPEELLEIIVASDGSTDQTVAIARDWGAKVVDCRENRGRALTQNDGVAAASGEIVIFTDAESLFATGFLEATSEAFADPVVGCAVGILRYRQGGDSADVSESRYMRYETSIRRSESQLGILPMAMGAGMGVRRSLWRDLSPTDDSDSTTPLDVIKQGFQNRLLENTFVTDEPPLGFKNELKARSRHTLKGLDGLKRLWGPAEWWRFPIVTWALFSHKFARWLTPLLMMAALVSHMFLLDQPLLRALFPLHVLAYALAIAGIMWPALQRRIPGLSLVSAFLIANLAIAKGLWSVVRGQVPARYTPIRNSRP